MQVIRYRSSLLNTHKLAMLMSFYDYYYTHYTIKNYWYSLDTNTSTVNIN